VSEYRVDILVRLVPEDTSLPIEELSSFFQADSKDARVWTTMETANKARKMTERLLDKVYGEEPI
jgi:hypothetical protein